MCPYLIFRIWPHICGYFRISAKLGVPRIVPRITPGLGTIFVDMRRQLGKRMYWSTGMGLKRQIVPGRGNYFGGGEPGTRAGTRVGTAYQVGPGRWARQPRTTLIRQHRASTVPITKSVVKPTTGAAALKTIGMKKPV